VLFAVEVHGAKRLETFAASKAEMGTVSGVREQVALVSLVVAGFLTADGAAAKGRAIVYLFDVLIEMRNGNIGCGAVGAAKRTLACVQMLMRPQHRVVGESASAQLTHDLHPFCC